MEIETIGDVTIIRLLDRVLTGHLLVHQLSEEVGRLIDEQASPMVVLNLTHVEIISSTMLGKLIALNRDIGKRGGRFVLTNVHVEVQGVFAIAKVDRLFNIMDDEADALAQI